MLIISLLGNINSNQLNTFTGTFYATPPLSSKRCMKFLNTYKTISHNTCMTIHQRADKKQHAQKENKKLQWKFARKLQKNFVRFLVSGKVQFWCRPNDLFNDPFMTKFHWFYTDQLNDVIQSCSIHECVCVSVCEWRRTICNSLFSLSDDQDPLFPTLADCSIL